MAKKGGLGRGFESLIPTNLVEEAFDPTRKEDAEVSKLIEVSVDDVVRDEGQPRKSFTETSLKELAESIKKHGVLQPIVVTKKGNKYQIVAGGRRGGGTEKGGGEEGAGGGRGGRE